jgi:hypothetical protein
MKKGSSLYCSENPDHSWTFMMVIQNDVPTHPFAPLLFLLYTLQEIKWSITDYTVDVYFV